MRSHNVTCHPTQVNAPRFNPSQICRYSTYLPRRDGRLSWPGQLVTYRDGLPVHRQSPIQVLTRPGVEQLRWSDTMRYRYATISHYLDLLQICCVLTNKKEIDSVLQIHNKLCNIQQRFLRRNLFHNETTTSRSTGVGYANHLPRVQEQKRSRWRDDATLESRLQKSSPYVPQWADCLAGSDMSC